MKEMMWCLAAAVVAVVVGCYQVDSGSSGSADDGVVEVADAGSPADAAVAPVVDSGNDNIVPVECVQHSDCAAGLVCQDGHCCQPDTVYTPDGGVVVPPACTSSNEVCDGYDNDCDGATDEGCPVPQPEVCDGRDNDCDGATDEGCPVPSECVSGTTRACGSAVGECRLGTQPCVNGRWDGCVGGVGVVAETCNNRDDDCDGTADEGLSCGSVETCNGMDDDHDGLTDEAPPGPSGDGSCSITVPQAHVTIPGLLACVIGVSGTVRTECLANCGTTERCGNDLDDDCDGTMDEGCTPLSETCNGLDDDGDGTTDEGTCSAAGAFCLVSGSGFGSYSCQLDADRDTVGDGRDNCS
ncbi:MAG: MopE-related protein, partial [Candidatus Uhrbacteria bacterium]